MRTIDSVKLHHESAREEDIRQRHRAGEEGIRAEQRQTEKQVVMEKVLMPREALRARTAAEGFLRDLAAGREQLILGEEQNQVLSLLKRGLDRRLRGYRRHQ
jgi:hypothetical protein